MSKIKWHTYGDFEAPHGNQLIVVTVDFAILHTLHGFGGVNFAKLQTVQGFGEVKSVIFALGASGEPKLIWGGFWGAQMVPGGDFCTTFRHFIAIVMLSLETSSLSYLPKDRKAS